MNASKTTNGQREFFTTGKMDMGFEVCDDYVVGVCLLYQSRADQEHEYMIREKSIVMIGERDLSAYAQEAKDLAYRSAISRIEEAGNTLPPSHVEQQTHASIPVTTSNDTVDQKQAAQNEPPVKPPDPPIMQQPAVPVTPAPVSQEPEDDLPSEDDDC